MKWTAGIAALLSLTVTAGFAAERSLNVDNLLTTAGKAAWTVENLGPQVSLSTVSSCCVDPGDGETSATAYYAQMGEPGRLVVTDFDSGEVQRVITLPQADGSYFMLKASDGNIYIATNSRGLLLRYKPGSDEVESLGKPADNVSFIWDLAEVAPGKIAGGCYKESTLFVYDIATGKFQDFGPAKEGEDYSRSVAWSPERQRLYAGIGSHADVVEFDPVTGKRRSVLPEEHKSSQFVYTIGTAGGQVIARLSPGDSVVFDPDSGKTLATIPPVTSNQISKPGPDGLVYYTSGQYLCSYDPTTHTGSLTAVKIRGAVRGFAWTTSADGRTSELLAATTGGQNVRYNPTSKKALIKRCELPPLPLHLQNIIIGPDGKLYSSAYVSGHLGIYDPATGKHEQYGNAKQSEGMTLYGDQIYLGTYPKANLTIFDTSRPAARSNPRTLFSLDDYGQDRPFGMLGLPEEKRVFMGTVPGYGLLGGALAVINLDDSKDTATVYRNLVPDQGIVSLAYKDGVLFGGTTIHGGLGIKPVTKDSHLFMWDVKTSKLIDTIVPVADRAGVTGLQIGSDGNVWGWAQDTLFVFDPETRKVIYKDDKFKHQELDRHFWRGAFMLPERDGKFYGSFHGRLYEIDAKTRELKHLAKGPISVPTMDADGNIYVIAREEVLRFNRK